MKTDENQRSIALLPAGIAAVLAAIGIAGMVFVFVSATQTPATDIGMRSADAVTRAGATITPTVPGPARSIRIADEARQDL